MTKFDLGKVGAAEVSGLHLGLRDLAPSLSVDCDPTAKTVRVESDGGRTGEVLALLDGFELNVAGPIEGEKVILKFAKAKVNGEFRGALRGTGAGVKLTDVASLRIKPGKKYTALGVAGDYRTLEAGVFGLTGSIDGEVDFRLERWPFWSWIPPFFQRRVDFHITKLYAHVLNADEFGAVGPCLLGQVANVPASAQLQLKPGPQRGRPYYRNGFVVNGADGRQVVNYLDPSGRGGILSTVADAVTSFYSDPWENGEMRLKFAPGVAACG